MIWKMLEEKIQAKEKKTAPQEERVTQEEKPQEEVATKIVTYGFKLNAIQTHQ